MKQTIQKITLTNAKKFIVCIAFLLLTISCILAFTSCSDGTTNNNTNKEMIDFTDSAGRVVSVPKNIERIAVVGPPTQNFILTFAPDKLVELATKLTDDQKEIFGEKVSSLPVMGQMYGGKGSIDKENLAKLNPDIIFDIGYNKSSITEDMDKLQEQVGVPCVHIEATLDNYDKAYTTLGNLLDMQDKAKTMSEYYSSKYSNVKSKLNTASKLKGLYVADEEASSVIATNTSQSEVIDSCTNNVAVMDSPSSKGSGNQVSVEQIALWNPDVIVVGYKSTYDKIMTSSEWSGINAVKNKRVYVTPTFGYNWMGQPPSTMQLMGLQWLTNLLYPQSFNIDLKQETQSFYSKFLNYNLSDEKYNEITTYAKNN